MNIVQEEERRMVAKQPKVPKPRRHVEAGADPRASCGRSESHHKGRAALPR